MGVELKPRSNYVPARGTTKGVVGPTGVTAGMSVVPALGTIFIELISLLGWRTCMRERPVPELGRGGT